MLLLQAQAHSDQGGRQLVWALVDALLRGREDEWVMAITQGAPA